MNICVKVTLFIFIKQKFSNVTSSVKVLLWALKHNKLIILNILMVVSCCCRSELMNLKAPSAGSEAPQLFSVWTLCTLYLKDDDCLRLWTWTCSEDELRLIWGRYIFKKWSWMFFVWFYRYRRDDGEFTLICLLIWKKKINWGKNNRPVCVVVLFIISFTDTNKNSRYKLNEKCKSCNKCLRGLKKY